MTRPKTPLIHLFVISITTWLLRAIFLLVVAVTNSTSLASGRSHDVDVDKVLNLFGPDGLARQSLIALISQSAVGVGWIFAGKSGTITLGVVAHHPSSDGTCPVGSLFALDHVRGHSLSYLNFLLGPQAVATNLYRCVAGFAFVFLTLAMKSLVTVGLTRTGHHILDAIISPGSLVADLARQEFLRDVIARRVLGALFQVVGWTLLGLAAGESAGERTREHH